MTPCSYGHTCNLNNCTEGYYTPATPSQATCSPPMDNSTGVLIGNIIDTAPDFSKVVHFISNFTMYAFSVSRPLTLRTARVWMGTSLLQSINLIVAVWSVPGQEMAGMCFWQTADEGYANAPVDTVMEVVATCSLPGQPGTDLNLVPGQYFMVCVVRFSRECSMKTISKT